MSATYRIELRRDPHSTSLPWDAVIFRLSDDKHVTTVFGKSRGDAATAAKTWVREEESADAIERANVFHVDDQGRDAEAPQSVKVP